MTTIAPPKELLKFVTKERLLEAVDRVVDLAGADYVYPAEHKVRHGQMAYCRYVWNDQPDCIGARVLAELGLTTEQLTGFEGTSITYIGEVYGLHPRLADGLRAGQVAQDGGAPWGHARQAIRTNLATVMATIPGTGEWQE